MAKLVFLNKNFEEQQYEFKVEKTTVGRGNHNTLVICDKSVSSTHCEILVNGPEVIVRDVGSSNGTFVDGARLNKEAQMQAKNGNILKFGLVEARLELPLLKNEEGGETKITAVMDLRELQANKRREEREKKAHSQIEGKVEPSANLAGGDMSGQTVLIPRPPRSRPAAPQAPAASEETSSKALLLIVAGVVVVALAVLVWWFWLKK